MYAQMLCGLLRRHAVVRIGAAFAYGLVRAVSFLQRNWTHLADDIEVGQPGQRRVTDPAVREAVAGVLRRPDPGLAEFIRREYSKKEGDCWAGILTRLWPNAKYLDAISTGAMAQYVPTLRYFTGGLPIVSTVYGSSECYFGLNLRPMTTSDPAEQAAYFEFLPTDTDTDADGSHHGQLVELGRVEAGREYELVVTTYGGLCRYRVGDVVRVAGFHNAAPELRFVRRGNVLLSVDLDKTDEASLHRAVHRASSASVLDYTARVSTDTIPGHYVLYWELFNTKTETETETGGVEVDLERCCLEMEEALDYTYREGRVALGSIGPLEIRIVRQGTFEEVADYAVSRGASVAQYKVPRCVTATMPDDRGAARLARRVETLQPRVAALDTGSAVWRIYLYFL